MTAKPVSAARSEPLANGQGAADSRTGLERHLAQFRRLFDSMNPAPYRKRDLDPEATACIIDRVQEAPSGRALEIFLCKSWPILAEAQLDDRPAVMDMRVRGTGATVAA